LEVNNVACRRLGYTREELLALPPSATFPPKYINAINDAVKQLKKSGYTIFEARHMSKDRREIPVEISAHLFNLDGSSTILSIARDITERKRAEKKLFHTSEQLRKLATRLQTIREEERTMIAQEIHDELGQYLTVLKIQNSLLINKLRKDQTFLRKKIDLIPVLDDEDVVVDYVIWDHAFTESKKPLKNGKIKVPVVIMAGGKGTRLEPFTKILPKPLLNEPGSGLHLHQYLGTARRSLFYAENRTNKLSTMCLHYIAGILHHSRALCAFLNPSTNSYKRLIPGFEAPTYADFGVGSRKTAIRLPKYLKRKKMMNIEYRIPDATANPYLALSAVLCAGIDGIKNKFKVNKREKLPHNVYDATNALKKDFTFLLQGGVFSMDVIESWIEVKTKQFEDIHNRPHPHEFTLYFGV